MSGRRRRGGDEFADEYANDRAWAGNEGARTDSGYGSRSGPPGQWEPGQWESGQAGDGGPGHRGRRDPGSPLDLPRQPGLQGSQRSRSMGYEPGGDQYARRPSSPAGSADRDRPDRGPAPGGGFPGGRSRHQAPDPPPTSPAPYSAGNRYRADPDPYPPADPYAARPDERSGRPRRGEDPLTRRAPSSEPPGRYDSDRHPSGGYDSGRGYADPLADRPERPSGGSGRREGGSRRGPEPGDPYGGSRDPRDGYPDDPRSGYGQSRTGRGGPDAPADPAMRRGAPSDPYGGPRDGYADRGADPRDPRNGPRDRGAGPRDGYQDEGYGQSRSPRGGRPDRGADARPARRPDSDARPDRYSDSGDQTRIEPGFLPGLRDRGDGYTPDSVEYYEEPERGRGSGGRRGGRGGGGGGGDGPPGRKRRGRWAGPSAALIVMLIVLVPLAVGGFFAYRAIESHYNPPNYSGAGTGEIIFQVKPGDSATTVGDRLVTDGVVASARALELAAEHSTSSAQLEPGFYRLHKHMNATLAWNLLLSPSARIQNAVTIPEGYRVSQVLATLAKDSHISAKDFASAIRDTAALHLPSYAKGNPEGYLYPDTYEIQPGMTATQVLQQMVTAYNNEAASVNLPQAAAHGNLTAAEVITVASLAQAEGGSVADFPKIARVIYNRLKVHMPLALDSTVMFALNTYGIAASDQQLRVNSPYNTYTHQGLPPGPIDNPGNAAIEAALHPASGNWLYFVTVNPKTGQTDFTNSAAQFAQFKNELEQYLATHHG